MHFMTWDSIFGPVTGKRNNHRKLGSKFSEWRTLEHDTMFDGYKYAAGSRYRAFESRDFGHVIFAPDSKTPEGHTPGKFWNKF